VSGQCRKQSLARCLICLGTRGVMLGSQRSFNSLSAQSKLRYLSSGSVMIPALYNDNLRFLSIHYYTTTCGACQPFDLGFFQLIHSVLGTVYMLWDPAQRLMLGDLTRILHGTCGCVWDHREYSKLVHSFVYALISIQRGSCSRSLLV
jgi:hypothetical protein